MNEPNHQELVEGIELSVYNHLREFTGKPDYPVKRENNLYRVYGIVDEDLDDLIIFAAESNHLLLPTDTSYWKTPVETVDDVIRFVSTFTINTIKD